MSNNIVLGWHLDSRDQTIEIPPSLAAHHTAVLAQSGAGKSFFLGRLIEELVLTTKAKVIVLDVNGDFRKVHGRGPKAWDTNEQKRGWPTLALPRYASAPKQFEADWKHVKVAYAVPMGLEGTTTVPRRRRKVFSIAWGQLAEQDQWALLDLDVKADSSECYCVGLMRDLLHHTGRQWAPPSLHATCLQAFKKRRKPSEEDEPGDGAPPVGAGASASPTASDTGEDEQMFPNEAINRAELLLRSVQDWGVWQKASSGRALSAVIEAADDPWDLLVIDLASVQPHKQSLLIADCALDAVWEAGQRRWHDAMAAPPNSDVRVPVFVVVDEAHNFCSADAEDSFERRVASRLIRFAAEGRKFGLFLIVATQRPPKVSPSLLGECANVCLLRLQSPMDHRTVASIWAVPIEEVARSRHFGTGDGLLFGRWVPAVTAMHAAYRRTGEGGANLRSSVWAQPRVDRA